MLNPLLLWFLPLALVPIALHLITLYRLKTVELSTFRFLMDSYIQQRRRIKLLEFLLMLLRTAFVALIVLTLSRPVIQKFSFMAGHAGRDVTIIMDAGAPMGLRTGGTTSEERAVAAARTIVNLLESDDRVTVIRAEDKPEQLISRFATQREPVLEQIAKIKPGVTTTNIAAALEEATNGPPRGTRIIYVLTDANRRAWSGMAGNPLNKSLNADTQLVVMNVGPTEPVVNLAVVGDPPRALHCVAGLPVLLSATVVNSSAEKPAETVLSVFIDNEQVSQLNLSLQPGQRMTRAVTVTPSHPGVLKGRFQLPADAFPDDDSYLFCLNVEPKIRVLIVTPPPPPPPGQPADLFIRTSLRTPLEAQAGSVAAIDAKQLASTLEITSVNHQAVSEAMLSAADVVILADVPLDAGLGARLHKYVSEGGGLMIFPGPSVTPEAYSQFLFLPPPTPGQPVPKSPLTVLGLLPPVGDVDDESKFQPVTGIDLNHPIFNAFGQNNGEDFFATTRLYRYFPIRMPTPPDEAAAAPGVHIKSRRHDIAPQLGEAPKPVVLMRLPDRSPILAETQLGEGLVFLAGFAATPDWSNLPLKPGFVPMLLRGVAHLRRPINVDVPSVVRPHDAAPIRVTGRWANAMVEVIDPVDKPTAIPLRRSGDDLIGGMLQTDRKGYYAVNVTPRAVAAPERLEMGFAVNLDSQADFATLNETQLRGLLQPAPITYLRGSANDPMLAQQLTQKREIWRTLIWVMFIVIGVEFLLSTLRPPKERKPMPPGQNPAPGGVVRRLVDRVGDLFAGAGPMGN